MEKVKNAKEKAEEYLQWTIDQKWDSSIANEKRKSSKEYLERMDWPLRLEAYSYLRTEYKDKNIGFGIEIRNLWDEWVELYKKGSLGGDKIFWPYLPNNEVENHISMFRAKEFFGIGGFHSYFTEAKNRTEFVLLPTHKSRVSWQVVRSPFLKSELSEIFEDMVILYEDLIKFLVRAEKEDSASQNSSLIKIIQIVFSLCFSNKFKDSAKEATSILIDYQKKNGSFIDSILGTCLCAFSIHAMKVDPSNIVRNRAIEYILNEQNKEGCWCIDMPSIHNSIGWKVFSTVLVLNTINFITNHKALLEQVKEARIQPIVSFEIPKGISWHDISICFVSEEVVQIRAGHNSEGRDFIQMGFADRRRRLKERTPDWSWMALKEFAKHQGEISLNDNDINLRIKRNLKSYVHVISIRLKELFKINEDPFYLYNRKTRSWKAKFAVIDST